MAEEPSRVERVIGAIDVVRWVGGAILVVVIAIAAFRSGRATGWALGAGLLAVLVASGWRGRSAGGVERREVPPGPLLGTVT
jgi:uncharacterized protein (DUF58 family)